MEDKWFTCKECEQNLPDSERPFANDMICEKCYLRIQAKRDIEKATSDLKKEILKKIEKQIKELKKLINGKIKRIEKYTKEHNTTNWKEGRGTRRAISYVINEQIKGLDKEVEVLEAIKKAIEEMK